MIKAVYKPRWICFKLYSLNWSDIYKSFLSNCFEELSNNKNCLSIIIDRKEIKTGFEEVQLIIRTTPYDTEEIKNTVYNNFSLRSLNKNNKCYNCNSQYKNYYN